MKNKISIKKSFLIIVIICWLIPVSTIAAFMLISYRNSIIYRTEKNMQDSLKNYISAVTEKMDEAVAISRKVSYDKVIEAAWRDLTEGNINESRFYALVMGQLNGKFHYDKRFRSSYVILTEEPDKVYYRVRNDSFYNFYIDKVHDIVLDISKKDTASIFLYILDEHLFLIRNLYTTTEYTKFGTLAVEMNPELIFEWIDKDPVLDFGFYIQDSIHMLPYESSIYKEEKEGIIMELSSQYTGEQNNKMYRAETIEYEGYLYEHNARDYHIGGIIIANRKLLYKELYDLYMILTIVVAAMLPILAFLFFFARNHISIPVSRMVEASKKVEKGEIGTIIQGKAMPNQEFQYLMESFNQMSKEVKTLFDYAYDEKMARKDAKIMALQSQINPHFLNNTLEMMNWQARMAGDITVSKMIEALGTLLDYSMDRTNRKLILLSEELRCADAYFYIISMRFGQRLQIEREIDEGLLQVLVPELILQPILENAVVHGVERVKQGTIMIKITSETELLMIDIINTGHWLTPEEREKIQKMLDGTYAPKEGEAGKHTSLGIRNVNERIKLIYGETYGLTIKQLDENKILSRICIPLQMEKHTKKYNIANIYK